MGRLKLAQEEQPQPRDPFYSRLGFGKKHKERSSNGAQAFGLEDSKDRTVERVFIMGKSRIVASRKPASGRRLEAEEVVFVKELGRFIFLHRWEAAPLGATDQEPEPEAWGVTQENRSKFREVLGQTRRKKGEETR